MLTEPTNLFSSFGLKTANIA